LLLRYSLHFLKEHISQLRAVGAVFENLAPLGLAIDEKANRSIKGAKTGLINTETGKTKILVIPANEELMIARETFIVYRKSNIEHRK